MWMVLPSRMTSRCLPLYTRVDGRKYLHACYGLICSIHNCKNESFSAIFPDRPRSLAAVDEILQGESSSAISTIVPECLNLHFYHFCRRGCFISVGHVQVGMASVPDLRACFLLVVHCFPAVADVCDGLCTLCPDFLFQ